MKIAIAALSLILLSNMSLQGEGLPYTPYVPYTPDQKPNMTTSLSSYSPWFKKVARGEKISTCSHQNLIYNRYHKIAKQWYVQTGGKCQFCAKITWDKKWTPIKAFGQLGKTFQQKHHNLNGQNQPSVIPLEKPQGAHARLRTAYLPSR